MINNKFFVDILPYTLLTSHKHILGEHRPGWITRCLLLLGYTNSTSTTTSCLGMLTTHTQAINNERLVKEFSQFLYKYIPPVVTQTSMGTNLLKTLQIFTELVLKHVGCHLRELAILDVLLSVEEPVRDFVLAGIGHDGHQFLNLK